MDNVFLENVMLLFHEFSTALLSLYVIYTLSISGNDLSIYFHDMKIKL